MAKIELRLSAIENDGLSELLIRLSIARDIVLRAKGGIMVDRTLWDSKKKCIRLNTPNQGEIMMRLAKQHEIDGLCNAVMTAFAKTDKYSVDKTWLHRIIYDYNHPATNEARTLDVSFDSIFEEFLNVHCSQLSKSRNARYRCIRRMIERFDGFAGRKTDIALMTPEWVSDFEDYLYKEHLISKDNRYSFLFEGINIEPRSQNLIGSVLSTLRAFLHWCVSQGYLHKSPFDKFRIRAGVYGTPYYLSIAERDQIYHFDLTSKPWLERQRDIFIFQCCIGCRVSDLERMTPANVVNGAIEYIPCKTKDGSAKLVRVPLNELAGQILIKYSDDDQRQRLLPFISTQKYNDSIKQIFTAVGITRIVSVLDPLTRLEVQKPLNEVASSHLARRTFIGNLYRQVQDPNLIGALSGHTEGSKAFSRYHDIDEGMKRKLVALLDTKPIEKPEENQKKVSKNSRNGILN